MISKKVEPLPTPAQLYQQVSKDVLQPARPFINETWHARAYGRKLSIYLTWVFLHTSLTPNQLSWLAALIGVLGGVVLVIPAWWSVFLAFLLIQLHMILDNSDGEVARFRQQFSPLGNYIDKLMHVFTYVALVVGLGVRSSLVSGEAVGVVVGLSTALLFVIAAFLFHFDPQVAPTIQAGERPAPKSGGLKQVVRMSYQLLIDVITISWVVVVALPLFGAVPVAMVLLTLQASLLLVFGVGYQIFTVARRS